MLMICRWQSKACDNDNSDIPESNVSPKLCWQLFQDGLQHYQFSALAGDGQPLAQCWRMIITGSVFAELSLRLLWRASMWSPQPDNPQVSGWQTQAPQNPLRRSGCRSVCHPHTHDTSASLSAKGHYRGRRHRYQWEWTQYKSLWGADIQSLRIRTHISILTRNFKVPACPHWWCGGWPTGVTTKLCPGGGRFCGFWRHQCQSPHTLAAVIAFKCDHWQSPVLPDVCTWLTRAHTLLLQSSAWWLCSCWLL